MRDAEGGLEVLLLRRNSRAGFVPRMYVFPGGRVDRTDADPRSLERIDGLSPEAAADRLRLADADPPAVAYYVAALREAFEETGILVGSGPDGSVPPTAAEDPAIDAIRDELMEDRIAFVDALRRMGCRASGGAVEYFAHWITPRRQPRRFDTRFFAARVAPSASPIIDPREMTDALWIGPAAALERHARGELPMILPTAHTLEALAGFAEAREALEELALRSVETILPDD